MTGEYETLHRLIRTLAYLRHARRDAERGELWLLISDQEYQEAHAAVAREVDILTKPTDCQFPHRSSVILQSHAVPIAEPPEK